MKFKNEKGITLISLVIAVIILLIIAGIGVIIGLDGMNTVDNSKKAGVIAEKTSLLEAIQGEIENIRTKKLANGGSNINDSDIITAMQNIIKQEIQEDGKKPELTFDSTNKKIKSTKGFEITIDEVKKQCQI